MCDFNTSRKRSVTGAPCGELLIRSRCVHAFPRAQPCPFRFVTGPSAKRDRTMRRRGPPRARARGLHTLCAVLRRSAHETVSRARPAIASERRSTVPRVPFYHNNVMTADADGTISGARSDSCGTCDRTSEQPRLRVHKNRSLHGGCCCFANERTKKDKRNALLDRTGQNGKRTETKTSTLSSLRIPYWRKTSAGFENRTSFERPKNVLRVCFFNRAPENWNSYLNRRVLIGPRA